MTQVPVFIICRDRLEPLRQLVKWLERHDVSRIIMVDNASRYPPLLDYFSKSPHEVVRLPQNLGPHTSVWALGTRDRYARGERYVVSDCDVVPDEHCPDDALDYLNWALRRHPTYVKVGLGLRIDDLPNRYSMADEVRRWEASFWHKQISANLYDAPIDTTFALYPPNTKFAQRPAIRTGPPYVAQHLPWYIDSEHPSEEDRYYRDNCRLSTSHWNLAGYENGSRAPHLSLADRVRRRANLVRLRRDLWGVRARRSLGTIAD